MATRPQTPTRPDRARTGNRRLPLRRPLTGSYATTAVIAILIAASSLASLANADTRYGGDPPSVLVSRGGDAANLVVVVPILLATMWPTRRRSLPGLLLWPGGLFYALYVHAIFVAAPFTALLFGYVAIVTLSATTLGAVITSIDGRTRRDRLAHTPARSVGAALVVIAVLAYAGLAATAVTAPGGTVNDLAFRGQWAVDTALGTPALLLRGVLLWRRATLAHTTGAGLLLVSGMGGLAFAAAAVLDGWLTQTATDPTVIAVHPAIATVDVILLAVFLRRASITTDMEGTLSSGQRGVSRPQPGTSCGRGVVRSALAGRHGRRASRSTVLSD